MSSRTGDWYVTDSSDHPIGSPVFIVSGSTVVSGCMDISAPGYYLLQNDIIDSQLDTCIGIASSDATFDGNSHTIDGTNAPGSVSIEMNSGIDLSNVVIKNAKITDWGSGIEGSSF